MSRGTQTLLAHVNEDFVAHRSSDAVADENIRRQKRLFVFLDPFIDFRNFNRNRKIRSGILNPFADDTRSENRFRYSAPKVGARISTPCVIDISRNAASPTACQAESKVERSRVELATR